MDDKERMILMKRRIINSVMWKKDVLVPLAKEFNITCEEIAEILMGCLDMSSLDSLHSTFQSAEYLCLQKKITADLRLCWLSGTLELISKEEADEIVQKATDSIYKGKPYEEALDESRQEILEILKNYKYN